MPVPAMPAVRQVRADRRRAVVGGRGADDRRALARQRERDRAADAARRAGDQRSLSFKCPAAIVMPPQRCCGQRLVERVAVARARTPRASSAMRLVSPASTLPGPAFDDVRDAPRGHRAASSRPSAPGSPPAARAPSRIASGARCSATSTLWMHGNRRRRERRPARGARASRSAAGFSSELWNGARHRQQHAALRAAAALASADRALDRLAVAGDHDLARRVEVHRLDHLRPAPPRAHAARDGVVVAAQDRRHRAPPCRHRLLHRLRAKAHQRHRVGEARARPRRPAPCIRPGCGRRRPPASARPRARHARYSRDAGGQHHRLRVDRQVERLRRAVRHQRPQVVAQRVATLRRTSRARPDASAKPSIMPTDCEPCPGNTNASFIGHFAQLHLHEAPRPR